LRIERRCVELWPVSGLTTDRLAFPRIVRSGVDTFLAVDSNNEPGVMKIHTFALQKRA
jgi:hypothetical protein